MSGAIVVGAGPGIGTAVARRVAREGLAVGIIARRKTTVDAVLAALSDADALGVTADVTDEPALRTALDVIIDRFGVPELLVYNTALVRQDTIGELTAGQQLDAWAVNVVGAITAVAHVAPAMVKAGGGTIVLTGGIPQPDRGCVRSPNCWTGHMGHAGSTWPPSRWPAPSPPAVRTTRRRSPSATGGSISSPPAAGNARSSTPRERNEPIHGRHALR
jgi:hypothetical protein